MKQTLNGLSVTCQKNVRVRIMFWVEVKARIRIRAKVSFSKVPPTFKTHHQKGVSESYRIVLL